MVEYQSDFFDDVRKMFAETDRRQQETALQMKETDLKLKELGKWLLGTSLAPLRRWNQHASSYYRKRRGREAEYEFSKRAGAGVVDAH